MKKLFAEDRAVWVLFAFAALLCALRFVDLNSAPFIQDEPQLQLLADQALAHHVIPWMGLEGTHGVHYGPTALWIYLPIRFFTDRINPIVAYFVAISIAGYALLTWAVWKSNGKKVAAWVAAFLAASPYLFFYSRLAWDNTFLIPLIAALCVCVVKIDEKNTLMPWIFLGVISGLIFNLHLMAVPILAAAAITTLPAVIRRRSFAPVAVAAVCFSVIVVPYLKLLLSGPPASQFDPFLRHIGSGLKLTPRYFTWWRIEYFIEGPAHANILIFGNGILGKLFSHDPSFLLKISAWCLFPLIAWKMLKRANPVPAMTRMAFFSFVFLMLYYGGLLLDLNQSHYMVPIWWVMMFLGALAIVESPGPLKILLSAAGAVTLLMNFVFICAAHGWIVKNHGTRGTHYTPVHVELEDAIGGICRDIAHRHPGSSDPVPVWVDPWHVNGIFPPAIEFYFKHEPDCLGRRMVSFRQDQPVPGMERYVLYYKDADELSAALGWRRVL